MTLPPMLRTAMGSIKDIAERSKEASYQLQNVSSETKNKALAAIAKELVRRKQEIFAANKADVENAKKTGLSAVLVKRLRFDQQKLDEALRSIESLISIEDLVGRLIEKTELDDGLILEKVTTSIGVIAVVFESRPDALVQISTLCIKSSNAVILKGGSEAENTNKVLASAINDAIIGVDKRFENAVQMVSTREEIKDLLKLDGLIDLVIPRGSNELVRSIQESTRIPVLGHAEGICHTYVDKDADVDMAVSISYDAKCQYPAVCNAMETLLVHKDAASKFLPKMAEKFRSAGVELRGDEKTRKMIPAKPATEEDWRTEYNDLVLSIKTVESIDEAVDHINRYGSHHTDAIVTENEATAKKFLSSVDSSSVLWNCSTRFADGFRYGLGAEVGISTNKTHARGPVGLEGLTIYKFRLMGKGHVVSDYVGEKARKFRHRKLK